MTAAKHAFFWLRDSENQFITFSDSQTRDFSYGEFEPLVTKTLGGSNAIAIGGNGSIAGEDSLKNPSQDAQLFVPIKDERDAIRAVVQICHSRELTGNQFGGQANLVKKFEKVFRTWFVKSEQVQQAHHEFGLKSRIQFLEQTSQSPTQSTPDVIANEAMLFLGADRVSLIYGQSGNAPVVAISGQIKFDQRSNVVQAIRAAGNLARSSEQPIWLLQGEPILEQTEDSAPPEELAIQIAEQLPCQALVVIPFKDSQQQNGKHSGAMVVEYFENKVNQPKLQSEIEWLVPRCSLSLAKWNTESPSKGLAHSRLVRTFASRKFAATTMLVLLAVGFLLLCFLPVNLWVKCEGVLQPESSRNVFAPGDGVVKNVFVDFGTVIANDTLLFEMRDDNLEIEIINQEGKLQETIEQIKDGSTRLLRNSEQATTNAMVDTQLDHLSARRDNIRKQLEILYQRRASSQVRSDVAGQVITWDARKQLEGLPCIRGQRLLIVADEDSDWLVNLHLKPQQLGHIEHALNQQEQDQTGNEENFVAVELVSPVMPSERISAKLDKLALRAHTDELGTVIFRAQGTIDSDSLHTELRSGTKVKARICCGKRPLGYVWFHDVLSFLKINWVL